MHAADRRPSDVNGPPTAAVKVACIGDPLHADLTEHAGDCRLSYPCIQQLQSRQQVSTIRCLHISRSTAVFFMVRDGGLICCLMPGHLLVRDTTPTDSVVMAAFQWSCVSVVMEFSRFSRRSREGVSGFTINFLDYHARLWEYDEMVGRRSVRTGLTPRWRTSMIRKNYDDHSLPALTPHAIDKPICGRSL
ncbi:hypothetical protein EVAR_6013_1 [Eumeta japonica]|uniref:Uncharacterized protein n=1 Tax=Eumeta variegata TaxID=151549 RepID=A0A4C1TCL3_EUMVA|nr:hypothetical protein EVAR_6013_1 [Eumeta japonica]